MTNRVFKLLLLLAASTASAQTPDQPLSLPDAIKLISPAVVQITYEMDRFPEETFIGLGQPFRIGAAGTGFVVNQEGYVVTALHVLRTLDHLPLLRGTDGTAQPALQGNDGKLYPIGRKRLLISYPMSNIDSEHLAIRGSFRDVEFSVVDRDTAHDLALLKPNRVAIMPKVPTAFFIACPVEGSRVATSGFPLHEPVMVTTSGTIASSWADNGFESVPVPGIPGLTIPSGFKDVFLIDLHLNHGNSGGPVYSVDTGAIIGLADAYAEDTVMAFDGTDGSHREAVDQNGRSLLENSGLGIVIPAKYIVELLRKNNLKWVEK
jgi:S1-C subfamily serine protease